MADDEFHRLAGGGGPRVLGDGSCRGQQGATFVEYRLPGWGQAIVETSEADST
jgi:hypothetical protein